MPLLFLGLLVLLAYVAYVFIPVAKAVHDTKSLMDAAVAYEQHPGSPDMRILVIGDSTAVGTGASPRESIAGRLGARYPNAEIVNDSENGMKLEEFTKRLAAHSDERYDLIVMQIGANDIVALTSEEAMRSRLHTALEVGTYMAPKVVVLCAGNVGLAPVFRWPLSALYTERARSVRELYIDEIEAYPTAHILSTSWCL